MENITCFGEVLWDVFPAHKKIGGAPLNVAIRLQSLGNNVAIISKIGTDRAGKNILEYLNKNKINLEGLQECQWSNTGVVNVVLDNEGSATYDIVFPSAWDRIELTEEAKSIVSKSDAFVFGSLVARGEYSRNTLYELLKLAKYKIFDVNLRAPHYTMQELTYLMQQADFIKFNDDEIFEIANELGFKNDSLEQTILFIAKEFETQTICVTKGGKGAILYIDNVFYNNAGYKIVVADTVGAGDSFLATLINQILKKTSPQEAINYACAVGAIVASREGANPEIKQQDIDKLIHI